MKFIVPDPFSIKKVLIFGGFGLCRFQHKVGMNSFPMHMNVFSYGANSFPWGMHSFRSKIPIWIVCCSNAECRPMNECVFVRIRRASPATAITPPAGATTTQRPTVRPANIFSCGNIFYILQMILLSNSR